jgi:hypothetical protein
VPEVPVSADPSAVASATLAAHLLVESGSALTRAGELLEFLGWADEADAIASALSVARRKVLAVRGLVDAHLDVIRAGTADEKTLALLELAKSELADQ